MAPPRIPLRERLLRRTFVNPAGPLTYDDAPCWIWQGGTRKTTGYGVITRPGNGKQIGTHVAAYELWYGPVPDGLVVDHLCHNADLACKGGAACPHHACINPAHLEAVPHQVNVARGRSYDHIARTGRCIHGHQLAMETIYINPKTGYRGCRICRTEAVRQYRERKRANG